MAGYTQAAQLASPARNSWFWRSMQIKRLRRRKREIGIPTPRSLGFAAVISTNQFKNGSHIEIDGKIWKIIDFQHVKPGKGGAFVRTKLRRIEDGSVIDKTFRAGEKFRPVHTESRKMQYLYDSGEAAVFMDSRDYEQIEIPSGALGDSMQWVLPNSEVEVLFVDEQPSGVQVPSAIDMKVTQTDPGLKGDTVSGGGNKPATLESGVTVQVPLFIEEGESIRVDTRTGEYVSRA
jgi:elongation factor P